MTLYDDIPDDPELAFLQLERSFFDVCNRQIEANDQNYDPTEDYLRYVSRTLAARTELGLKVLEG